MSFFSEVLMVSPEYFTVAYAINPYMTTKSGELQTVDKEKAMRQWQKLKATYESLGFPVQVISGKPSLPDMVFAANQSFPFVTAQGKRAVILSNMRSEFRKPEVASFREFYQKLGFEIFELPGDLAFEGNGDALIHPGKRKIWGGFGPRTDLKVYEHIARLTGYEVETLELKRAEYYHLDTCLAILNETTAVIAPSAFTSEGLAKITKAFINRIEVDDQENLKYFCANCHSPDGNNVLLHKGSTRFLAALKAQGFTCHELDTSEYLKSGGSVFCMKMMIMSE